MQYIQENTIKKKMSTYLLFISALSSDLELASDQIDIPIRDVIEPTLLVPQKTD
jgi:hypothetical protein